MYQGLVFFLPVVVLKIPNLGNSSTTAGILVMNKLWRKLTSDEATLLTIQERMFHYCDKTNISSPHSTLFFDCYANRFRTHLESFYKSMCNQCHGNITMIQLQPFNLVGPTLNLQIKNKQFIWYSFYDVLNLRRAPLVVR